MKYIPLLFSTPMVQAILEDRKTMTKRTVKMPKDDIKEASWGYTAFTPERHISFRAKHSNGQYGESFVKCPYGKKGDILWVRETWQQGESWKLDGERFGFYYTYKADNKDAEGTWRPSIFMPKAACRLFLEIESIKVERLQEISEEDAIAEGVEVYHDSTFYVRYGTKNDWCATAYASFAYLWEYINGAESWNANPWVWVISFKKIERPAGFTQ